MWAMVRSRRTFRALLTIASVGVLGLAACSAGSELDAGVAVGAQPGAAVAGATPGTVAASDTGLARSVTTAAANTATANGEAGATGSGMSAMSAMSVAMDGNAGETLAANAVDHDEAGDHSWNAADEVGIALQGSSAQAYGQGVTIEGSTVTIDAPGTYRLSGSLRDGAIIVQSEAEGMVRLVLDGVDITSSTTAAIAVLDASEAMVVLAEGSTNVLRDATTYATGATGATGATTDDAAADLPSAALFSDADLTITGGGALEVTGNANDAIASQDGLVISATTVKATAVDDAIRGKDYLIVDSAVVTVQAGGDGLKSDNGEDQTKGYVAVVGGSVTIEADTDGIDAATDAVLAGTSVRIDSGDDAVHSEASLVIAGGTVAVTSSYEALEANRIVIDGGEVALRSSDDGINAVGSGALLEINGGNVVLDADGDGLDANGSIAMTGGTVVVTGPTAQMNGALDYDGNFEISGGQLIATGSSGMAMAPSQASSQRSLLASFSTQTAGRLVEVRTADGETIVSVTPAKAFSSIAVSTPAIVDGVSYQIVVDGTVVATTTAADAVSPMGPGGPPGR